MSDNHTIQSIHDRFFQVSLGDKQIATDFFKAHLPAHIQKKIDWASLKLEPGRFVDKHCRTHYSDVLYSVNLANEPGYLYVLAEHKSYPDQFLPLQLLRYMCEIWQRHLQHYKNKGQGKGEGKLPLVYPICFYHGRQSPYPYSTDIRDCFANRQLADELFSQPFPLADVTQYQDEELETHGLAASFEIIQKHIFARDLWETIQNLLNHRQLTQLLTSGSGDYFEQLIKYIVEAGQVERVDDFFGTLVKALPEAEKQIMTIAEQLQNRAREEEKAQIAREMLKDGQPVDRVAKYTQLPVSEIERLKQH